ncbi:MAG: xylose isomerase [Planctomycetaceae bacterium]|nr:MAG: xylose isomerase [Planctomycetaceae bacterium]
MSLCVGYQARRREFLQALGGAMLAGAILQEGKVGAVPSTTTRRLRKAVKWSMVAGDGSVQEKFQMLREVGFEGVDMDRPADVDEVIRAQRETGLIVHGVVDYVHWNQPLSDPDPAVRAAGVEGLKRALHDCKAYGGTTVLLVPAVVTKQVRYDDAYRRSQEEIRKVLPLAEQLQIKILFENVWNNFLLSPLEFARYIDEFSSPWVGAYFDVGNIVRYGWPEHWIHILGARIGKLDIKEYSRKLAEEQGVRKGFQAEIGEGDDGCDWPAVLQALRDINYSGWATAEVRGGGRERLLDISRRMDRIFAGYEA